MLKDTSKMSRGEQIKYGQVCSLRMQRFINENGREKVAAALMNLENYKAFDNAFLLGAKERTRRLEEKKKQLNEKIKNIENDS